MALSAVSVLLDDCNVDLSTTSLHTESSLLAGKHLRIRGKPASRPRPPRPSWTDTPHLFLPPALAVLLFLCMLRTTLSSDVLPYSTIYFSTRRSFYILTVLLPVVQPPILFESRAVLLPFFPLPVSASSVILFSLFPCVAAKQDAKTSKAVLSRAATAQQPTLRKTSSTSGVSFSFSPPFFSPFLGWHCQGMLLCGRDCAL